MEVKEFQRLRECVVAAGYGSEIVWTEEVQTPKEADTFALEYAFVVICSGMKEQIARVIFDKVRTALTNGRSSKTVFGHKLKTAAIDKIWNDREFYFRQFIQSTNKIGYLEHTLPFIGSITQYHLARNLGIDCCKPDRHLVRIASKELKTADELCRELAEATGYRIGTVDVILWRAANLGFI